MGPKSVTMSSYLRRRSHVGRRAFEVLLSLLGLVIYPLVAAAAAASAGESLPVRIRGKLSQLTGVIRGRLALVGYNSGRDYIPPDEWGLRPAVFAVDEAIDLCATREEIGAAYWFYVRNQSASLDWDIIVRSLRQLRHRTQGSNAVSR